MPPPLSRGNHAHVHGIDLNLDSAVVSLRRDLVLVRGLSLRGWDRDEDKDGEAVL